jgi:hypothetical protein
MFIYLLFVSQIILVTNPRLYAKRVSKGGKLTEFALILRDLGLTLPKRGSLHPTLVQLFHQTLSSHEVCISSGARDRISVHCTRAPIQRRDGPTGRPSAVVPTDHSFASLLKTFLASPRHEGT